MVPWWHDSVNIHDEGLADIHRGSCVPEKKMAREDNGASLHGGSEGVETFRDLHLVRAVNDEFATAACVTISQKPC